MKDAAQLAAVVALLSGLALFAACHVTRAEREAAATDEHADPANWGEH